jgi:alpha-beta hydrolase superfamily lysophospholipase
MLRSERRLSLPVLCLAVAVLVLVLPLVPSAGAPPRALPLQGATPVPGEEISSTAAPMACDPDGLQASGAVYRICMPTLFWNRDLVIWAHGYVAASEPVGIPEDQMTLPGGILIDSIVTGLGYGFATTSYSVNGLAVVQGLADLVDLVDIFAATKGTPERVFLVGASEGGLITVLAVEQYPSLFDGGLALCGPYGDFREQIDYLGDFRILFDYFFPGRMPGSPVDVPEWLIETWDSYYPDEIRPAVTDPANAGTLAELLAVGQAPYDAADPATQEQTVETLLWYNVVATNDGKAKLGGQPYDNLDRAYQGSLDDVSLNQEVARFGGEAAALAEIEARYQPSGRLAVPLVTLHTTGDPLVPYWHAGLYADKVSRAGSDALHEQRQAERYGHCQFEMLEVLGAFYRLVQMVDERPPYQPPYRQMLPLVWAGGS